MIFTFWVKKLRNFISIRFITSFYTSHIYIKGYGYRVVEDIGGGVRGNHIDIFKESHYECLQHGIKYAKVYLVKNSI